LPHLHCPIIDVVCLGMGGQCLAFLKYEAPYSYTRIEVHVHKIVRFCSKLAGLNVVCLRDGPEAACWYAGEPSLLYFTSNLYACVAKRYEKACLRSFSHVVNLPNYAASKTSDTLRHGEMRERVSAPTPWCKQGHGHTATWPTGIWLEVHRARSP